MAWHIINIQLVSILPTAEILHSAIYRKSTKPQAWEGDSGGFVTVEILLEMYRTYRTWLVSAVGPSPARLYWRRKFRVNWSCVEWSILRHDYHSLTTAFGLSHPKETRHWPIWRRIRAGYGSRSKRRRPLIRLRVHYYTKLTREVLTNAFSYAHVVPSKYCKSIRV